MNVPIPEIYVQVTQADDGSEQFGVVDGQQRLRTILQFVGLEHEEDREGEDNNNFSLSSLPKASPHSGKSFADVEGEARKSFFQYEVCVRFLYTDNLREVEDVFKRLNKFTMPLKPQELRNATFHGAFAKLSEQLADDEYWAVNRIITPAAIRRMSDIEMMSDLLIGLIHGPQGGSAKVIDEYYEHFEEYDSEFPEQGRVRRVFSRALSTIQRVFPNIGDVPRWANRADFYSLFVALGATLGVHELPSSRVKQVRQGLIRLAEAVNLSLADPSASTNKAAKNYARAIEKGSNDRARRVDRHEVLVAILEPLVKAK